MSIDYRDLGYGEIGLTIPNPAEPKRVTNADRIRAMTDEKLATWLCDVSARGGCAHCIVQEYCYNGHNGYVHWLKQEVNDG